MKGRMAEVDHQLLSTRNNEDTDQQFLDVGISIRQIEEDIKKEMEERSHEARSGAFATDVDAQEQDALHHQCYVWLRVAKCENIERERLRLCAPARQRAVKSAVDSMLGVKIPQGSPHKEVQALIFAIPVARGRLKMVGAEREIFSRSGTITSLVSKLEEITQTRWYLSLTKDSEKSKDEAFVQWLKIQEVAGQIWWQQRIISAWCNAERPHQQSLRQICKMTPSTLSGMV